MAGRVSTTQQNQKQEEIELLKFSSWVEIDLNAIAHNLQQIRSHSKASVLPILKGNAYGHGASILAPFLISHGCTLLGVGTVDEALSILSLSKVPLLVLAPPLPHQVPLTVKHDITNTITSDDQLETLSNAGIQKRKKVMVHLKIDTGLGRLGATHEEALEIAKQIKRLPFVSLTGVFTHFADASHDQRFTGLQLHRLLQLKAEFNKLGYNDLVWHAANSKALLSSPNSQLDLVRIGTLLYGQTPQSLDSTWQLADTWEFKTRLIEVKTLPPGHSVGYSREYRTKSALRMGVIPVGYNHGLKLEPQVAQWRQFKHALTASIKTKPFVFHEKKPLPILGKVSMGLTCLDLSGAPELEVGDEITVKMRRATSNSSLPKVYFLNGQIKCILSENQIFHGGQWKTSSTNLF